jgi:arylsulfatase A-like enzyme
MDLTPTILDLAGLPPLEHCQGLSLRPLLEDPSASLPNRDFLVDGQRRGESQRPSALIGRVYQQWWSLIATTDTTGTGGTFQPAQLDSVIGLFALEHDPAEQENLMEDYPEVVADLKRRLQAAITTDANLAAQLNAGLTEPIKLSKEAERQLRSLGY